MSPKKKRVDHDLLKVRAIAKAQLKSLSKKSITWCMDLIDFNGSARTFPTSAAQLAWFAFLFRQIKTAPHSVVDGFLESGGVSREESLLIRQLRAAPSPYDEREKDEGKKQPR